MVMKGSSHSGRDAGSNWGLLSAILTFPEPPLPHRSSSPVAGETFAGVEGLSACGSAPLGLTQYLTLQDPMCV